MSIETIKELLYIALVFNYSVVLLWFSLFIFAYEPLYKLHTRWFELSHESFHKIHYMAMAFYKILILFFNVAPLVALSVLG